MRTRWYCAVLALALFACSMLVACSPPDEVADAGAADAAVAGESYTFKVLQRTTLELDLVETPLAGAAIAFQRPDGTVAEATTSSAGIATVHGVDWNDTGLAAFTVYAVDHVIRSSAALKQSDLERLIGDDDNIEVKLWLKTTPYPATVNISGTVRHMTDTSRMLTITSNQGSGHHQAAGPNWSLAVWPNRPLKIVVLEWGQPSQAGDIQTFHRWVVVDHAAVTGPTNIEIDLDASTTPVHFSGKLNYPTSRLSSFLPNSNPYMIMLDSMYFDLRTPLSNFMYFGGVTRMTKLLDDSGVEYQGQYVPIDGVTPVSQFRFLRGDWIVYSLYHIVGALPQGLLPRTAADPPVVVEPLEAGATLDTELVWTLSEEDMTNPDREVQFNVLRDFEQLWIVTLPHRTTRVVLPPLPTVLDRAMVFGTTSLQCTLQTYELDDTGNFIAMQAQAASIYLEP